MEKKQYDSILGVIPASFKSKLDRIRRYLNLDKASVMVGAGFSRNADIPSHIKVKQWKDLGKDIYCRLYSVNEVKPEDLAFKTPMRLASLFSATFGRSELDNLIKDSIPDDRMRPGALHKQLLSLPWRDVFTTNYDTLLEKGCEGLNRAYSVITTKEMLLYKNSPRIVKLHGSFPDKTPFVMTEEDYRTYPVEHPEFVNTVRQALVESIFCLIGFSGDDPNFISWQGWLRDVMGEYAGPSYLITYDENNDESFSVLMKERGIDVLNFSIIDGINNYNIALEFLFQYLSEKPDNWSGSVHYSSNDIKSNASGVIQNLRNIRLSYPGWFVLPSKYYNSFTDMEMDFPSLEKAFDTIDDGLKEDLLFELDWRANISLTFNDFTWYLAAIEKLVDSYGDKDFSHKAVSLALSLLRIYRYHPDKSDRIQLLKDSLQEQTACMSESELNRYYYICACNALSVLDYEQVSLIMREWNPSLSCYEGIIHKSAVLMEVGDSSSALKLLTDAYERITQSLSQNDSIEEKSLRKAIESLLAICQETRIPDIESQYSFVANRDSILAKINESMSQRFEIKHGYGISTEKRSWNMTSGIVKNLLYPYRLLRLYEAYGVPYGKAKMSIDEKVLSQALSQLPEFGLERSLGVVLRAGSRHITEAYATRKAFNILSQKDADRLADSLLTITSQSSYPDALRRRKTEVMLPLLSRLSTSCSQTYVTAIFKFSFEAYRLLVARHNDDINLIYSSLMPESIQEVFSTVFSAEIINNRYGEDFPIPSYGYSFYSPDDVAVSIICDGLASGDSKIRELAYCRAHCLLSAKIDDSRREILKSAIRKWRIKEGNSRLVYHSYGFVETSPEENEQVQQRVTGVIKNYLEADYIVSGSSINISSLGDILDNLNMLVAYLSIEQKDAIIEKLIIVLEENFEQYSKDDSNEYLGGMRSFVYPLFETIKSFIVSICREGFTNRILCGKLFSILENYLPTHLPVRATMEVLNVVSNSKSESKMRAIITSQLFSKNEHDVIDSCNALISHTKHHCSIQSILQEMIFYCEYADSDRKRLYLQTISLVPFQILSEKTKEKLAVMLRELLDRVPNQDYSEEQKADIMHDGVQLVSSLKKESVGTSLENAIMEWEKYATNENVYNDVRQPWFIS